MGTKPRFPQAGHRSKPHAPGTDELRRQLAADAARIMAEEGVRDFHAAKRKAAARLGLPETKHLPGNDEVDSALQEYLRLFHAGRLTQSLRRAPGFPLRAGSRASSVFRPPG